jgi:chromosomal replication initiation ATPase DnaA
MKRDIFEAYVDRVTDRFGITRERLFAKDKSRDVVDARHMLYYLCSERPMTNTYIKQYMGENGYNIDLPSISHGLKRVEYHISQAPDYTTLINQLK